MGMGRRLRQRDGGGDPAAAREEVTIPMETILIIDDDPGFRGLMETILRGEGYTVQTAGSVAEARDCGSRSSYHLVISDLKLPDGSGLDVLRHWKQEMPETPVVVGDGRHRGVGGGGHEAGRGGFWESR